MSPPRLRAARRADWPPAPADAVGADLDAAGAVGAAGADGAEEVRAEAEAGGPWESVCGPIRARSLGASDDKHSAADGEQAVK